MATNLKMIFIAYTTYIQSFTLLSQSTQTSQFLMTWMPLLLIWNNWWNVQINYLVTLKTHIFGWGSYSLLSAISRISVLIHLWPNVRKPLMYVNFSNAILLQFHYLQRHMNGFTKLQPFKFSHHGDTAVDSWLSKKANLYASHWE